MNTFVLAALVLGLSQAISVKWTGYANNNQWTTNTNWYPDQVPGPNDDVTIESGTVLLTNATGVNSLTMGTTFNAPANLTLFADFFVGNGGMYVEENGNLFINAGQGTVTGVINIDGNLFFASGIVSGQITVSKKGAAFLDVAGAKVFNGCNFVCQGPATVSDVLMLGQSSVVTLSGATTASGQLLVQATDTTQVLFDVSAGSFEYSGPGTFSVQAPTNFGTLTITGNLTLYNTVQFAKMLTIPKALVVNTVGSAIVSMTNGVTGAGMLNAAGSSLVIGSASLTGFLNIIGGNVTVQTASSVTTVSVAGGHLFVTATLTASQLNLISGIVSGSTSSISAANLYLKGRGSILDTAVAVSSVGYIATNSLLVFGKHGQISVASTATLTIAGSFIINGVVSAPGFANNGMTVIPGAFQTQNINVFGSGAFNVSGKLKVSSASFTAGTINLQGAGNFKGTNSMISVSSITAPTVQGVVGVYNFQCPVKCEKVTTSSTPTSAFSFNVAASTSKH